ncbi:hypothetical protein BDZ97DRAFT_1927076 [Flammula alnicola]|nr:hypothetical protein BDZ97DRAFT_1927076 [Flammula alnicola]
MDVASTVYNLITGTLAYIGQLGVTGDVTNEIASTLQLMQTIITPLFSDPKTLEANQALVNTLQSMQEILCDIDHHLRLWNESRYHRFLRRVYPLTATQQLKDDHDRLWLRYVMLTGGLQIVEHIHGYNVIHSVPHTPQRALSIDTPTQSLPFTIEPNVSTANPEVVDFWDKCYGDGTISAKTSNFCADISSYLALNLSPIACKRLLLRLDPLNMGSVSYETFKELIKNGKMTEVISSLSEDPPLPLLVWIDDDLVGTAHRVLEAMNCRVTVIQLASTSAAKTWIEMNQEYLKAHDNPGDIRFISNQVRIEPGPDGVSFRNEDAGTQITEYIRGQGFKAPVLIYTDRQSILRTRYVESDRMAGSVSSDDKVFKDYVAALGARKTSDKGWNKFDA